MECFELLFPNLNVLFHKAPVYNFKTPYIPILTDQMVLRQLEYCPLKRDDRYNFFRNADQLKE